MSIYTIRQIQYASKVILVGIFCNMVLFFQDILFEFFSFFFAIVILILITLYTTSILFSIYQFLIKKEKELFYCNAIFIVISCLIFIFQSELFKSRIVLEAIDNSYSLNVNRLKLRANHQFEVIWLNPFGSGKFEGRYLIKIDTLILLDKPYDNDYIPQKLLIKKDRVVPIFIDSVAKPKYFFKIMQNEIKP